MKTTSAPSHQPSLQRTRHRGISGGILNFATRKSWREWLTRNNAKRDEAFLEIYKKPPKNKAFSNIDALEEALCFGWIDGWFKPIDAERWVIRYTRRRKGSSWSVYNIARAWKLLNEGRMTAAGVAKLPTDAFQTWEKHRPSPTIIQSKGARKGEIRFADGKNYMSKLSRPALTPL